MASGINMNPGIASICQNPWDINIASDIRVGSAILNFPQSL